MSQHTNSQVCRAEEWMTTTTNKQTQIRLGPSTFPIATRIVRAGGRRYLLWCGLRRVARLLIGPRRVLFPRTRPGHGSGLGLFPSVGRLWFFLFFLHLILFFWYTSPLQGLASIASAWEFFFYLSWNGSEYRPGSWGIGYWLQFLHQPPPTTGSNQLAHIWVYWSKMPGTARDRDMHSTRHCMDGFIA